MVALPPCEKRVAVELKIQGDPKCSLHISQAIENRSNQFP